MKTRGSIPAATLALIQRMLDEDFSFPKGTAEKAAEELAKRAYQFGREDQFKSAIKFWKNHPFGPQDSIIQWFHGVFNGTSGKKPCRRPKTWATRRKKESQE